MNGLRSPRTGRALTSPYFDNVDATEDLYGDVLVYDFPIRCLSFQGVAVQGTPVGEMKLQLSIIDDVWSDLVGCKPIAVDMSLNNEFMFIVPEQTFYAGKIRMVWTAGQGSNGVINVLKRLMPW